MNGNLHKFNQFSAVGPWNIPGRLQPTPYPGGVLDELAGKEERVPDMPQPTAQPSGGSLDRWRDVERDQFSQTVKEYLQQVIAGMHPLPTAEQEQTMMARALHFGQWDACMVEYLLRLTKWVKEGQ